MFYITGDKHGHFMELPYFCKKNNTTKDDIYIVLGDAGINYYGAEKDKKLKEYISSQNITLFCIHGNHEQRPQTIETYKEKIAFNGKIYYEENYPNILFAKDGEIYDLDGHQTLVIGGAYSVDKYYRIKNNEPWWSDEQPSKQIKNQIIDNLQIKKPKIDIVLSHTCPYKYIPKEAFIPGLNQDLIDQQTEKFLDEIEQIVDYQKWYCGHFHIDKEIDNIEFLYGKVKKLGFKR